MGFASKTYTVDGTKLSYELKKRGLNGKNVSIDMGYNSSFIANAISRGKINYPGMKMLTTFYNIRLEDIAPDENATAAESIVEVREAPATEPIDYERLYEVIYTAVYQAVKKAWAE